MILALRLIHIVCGALWVGFALYGALFLMPAIEASGPDGGKVMGALQRGPLMKVMPLLALGTILPGFWLYWKVSGGFQHDFMASRMGMALGTGGVMALVAFLLGMIFVQPAMVKAGKLALTGENPEELQRLRRRGDALVKFVSVLLLLALVSMSIARYL